jgi:hypothetical protein
MRLMGAHVAGTSMRSGTQAAVKAQSEAIVEAVLGGVNVLQTAGHVHDGAADEVPPHPPFQSTIYAGLDGER